MKLLLKIKLAIITLLFCAAGTSAFASASSYNFSIDTTSLNGSDGYLYFQYAAVMDSAIASTTTISNFTTDGTLGATATGAYDDSSVYVTGTLPSVFFANTNIVNDYNQAIHFGNSISFNLSLAPNASGALAGDSSTFSFWLFQDALGSTPLLSSDGLLLTVDLYNDGTTSAQIYTAQVTSAVPVPSAGLLLGSALLGLIGAGKRTKK